MNPNGASTTYKFEYGTKEKELNKATAPLSAGSGSTSQKFKAEVNLEPETKYECAHLPVAPSEAGDVEVPVRQLRDPFVFEERGRLLLFYAGCGEQTINAAELTLR